ncbi:UDP-N-acetylmuramate dehydrogenase [Neisseria sp. HSC-16F19]|nr:UDP-N-acetylmuramate dehydrogenase [Neisseria sp. HSC-16F19]MCP2040802.1 UDP-N-acetylmuramate dehydrogenase [Neisseria sp. HSC-16F19]
MQVEYRVDLRPHHTFGLPVHAAAWVELTDAARLPEILALPEYDPATVLWLGGGSNVLFGGDYAGLVVHLAHKGIAAEARADGRVAVTAQAGEIWHDFVQHTVAQGWYGLENLSLIPGTVGAAPVQNIGAYGVEVGEYIASVYCFDVDTQQFVTLDAAACRFAYRDSLFKQEGRGRYVICAVTFVLDTVFAPRLAYGDVAAVAAEIAAGRAIGAADVAAAVCRIRQSKLPDPKVLGNAGSFFKNPVVDAETAAALLAQHPTLPHYPQADGRVKLAAGWLIDQCGLKGFAVGGAAVHDKQALVLVNRDHASAADVRALAQTVQARVAEGFGVALEPEPVWLAC